MLAGTTADWNCERNVAGLASRVEDRDGRASVYSLMHTLTGAPCSS